MMISERIQAVVHAFDVGGTRWLNYAALTAIVVALAVWYDTHCFHDFDSPEAMDTAQVARNVSEGKGFSTEFIRPFDVYLLEKHNAGRIASTNAADAAELSGRHPDLANAPFYPFVLAGLFKLTRPELAVDTEHTFWSDSRQFRRYKPEFEIAVFNQVLFLLAVLLTFRVARAVLDTQAAWISAILMLLSDSLWKFSVSGLSTMMLLLIFLGVIWSLAAIDGLNHVESPHPRRRIALAVLAGLLVGLGMLTRYSFGWLIVPVAVFLVLFGGQRRPLMAAIAVLAFFAIVSPWVVRNLAVSGTPLGVAGFALFENSEAFVGAMLPRSLHPEMYGAYHGVAHLLLLKLVSGLPEVLQNEVPQLGDGWVGMLFLGGLLLGLRNVAARRLRYFAVVCLGVLLVITPLGRTQWSVMSPDMTNENLLVLLMPLAVIFGVAFFLTLLNQMNISFPPVRYGVIALVVILTRLQFGLTLLPPKERILAYPPYYPPDIQQISGWMHPDELLMSDIPWAVAWYGDHQCVWISINSQYEFFQFNDYVKRVSGLYLTLDTLNSRLFTECLQGGVESWGHFVLKSVAAGQIPPQFPLKSAPSGLASGLFLTDHVRWETE